MQNGPQRYVITSAQAYGGGHKGVPNRNFLAGLKKYCAVWDAQLIILPMAGSSVRQKDLHHLIADSPEVWFGKRALNKKIDISDMIVPPQNVDPASGRLRFPQRDKTLILAHPKQRFKAVPNSNFKIPKVLLSPGALTSPNYNDTNHRGDAAKRDHVYGALIVEIVSDVSYHFRHVRAGTNGVFIDLGVRYNGDKEPVQEAYAEALVPGDIHLGDHDPVVVEAMFKMIELYKVKRLFLHDVFNGHSVNHHNAGKMIQQIQDVENHRSSLGDELKGVQEFLVLVAKAMGRNKEVLVVPSNHNEFLHRYLEGMRFVDDPVNAKIAAQLIEPMVRGVDPVEVGVRLFGNIPKNVRFLTREDDYKVRGFQLASHGDMGLSGARGSMRSRELAHGKSITGHTHTPEILRDTYIVGTSTYLNLPYTIGSASSWMNTHAILYTNGTVQMLNVINGRWTTQ